MLRQCASAELQLHPIGYCPVIELPVRHPKKTPVIPLLYSNKRHCHSVCMKNSSFLPCPTKSWQSMRDKTLQCHLEENTPKRILTGAARLLRWHRHHPDTRHSGTPTLIPGLKGLSHAPLLLGRFGEKFSTSKMTEFLIRNWRQKVWV